MTRIGIRITPEFSKFRFATLDTFVAKNKRSFAVIGESQIPGCGDFHIATNYHFPLAQNEQFHLMRIGIRITPRVRQTQICSFIFYQFK